MLVFGDGIVVPKVKGAGGKEKEQVGTWNLKTTSCKQLNSLPSSIWLSLS